MNGEEKWKPIVGFEGTYEVSILGVRRVSTGRVLKQSLDNHGCPHVILSLRGQQTTHRVAHLVADAFLPPKKPTDQVLRHLNDNKLDNRVENLAWGTHKDNAKDSIRNETFVRGITHGMARLTEDIVREIRLLYATGNFTQKELALKFGVDKSAIGYIVRRKTWKHVV